MVQSTWSPWGHIESKPFHFLVFFHIGWTMRCNIFFVRAVCFWSTNPYIISLRSTLVCGFQIVESLMSDCFYCDGALSTFNVLLVFPPCYPPLLYWEFKFLTDSCKSYGKCLLYSALYSAVFSGVQSWILKLHLDCIFIQDLNLARGSISFHLFFGALSDVVATLLCICKACQYDVLCHGLCIKFIMLWYLKIHQ